MGGDQGQGCAGLEGLRPEVEKFGQGLLPQMERGRKGGAAVRERRIKIRLGFRLGFGGDYLGMGYWVCG